MGETSIVVVGSGALAPSGGGFQRPNPVLVYLESLASDNSKRCMRDALRRVLRSVDRGGVDYETVAWWELEPQHTTTIRARLIAGYGVNTAKVALAALRGVLRQCFLLGYIDQDRFKRVTGWQKVYGGDEALTGRMLSDEEIARIRAAAARGSRFEAALDVALFDTTIGTGARRDEMARLALDALSNDGAELRILGKRGKVRHMPLLPWMTTSVKAWLEQRARFPFTAETMFVHVRDGKGWDRPMSPWLVWARLKALGARASVEFTPHDLRRTYISTGLENADVVTVQKLAGHADPRTTARYDRRPQETKVKAVKDSFSKWGK